MGPETFLRGKGAPQVASYGERYLHRSIGVYITIYIHNYKYIYMVTSCQRCTSHGSHEYTYTYMVTPCQEVSLMDRMRVEL